jgi:YbbR domain-containing protein
MVYQAADITLDDIIAPVLVRLEIDVLDSVLLPVLPELEAEADEGFAAGREHAVEPATALLIGPRSHLQGIQNLRTVSRKLTSLRNPVTITLPVAIPDGYGFRVEPDSVAVTVPVSPVKTRVFSGLTIQVFNAPAGARLRTDPADLRLELTGPPDEVDHLDRQALTLSVDCREAAPDGRVAVKVDCPPGFKLKALSFDTVTIINLPNANPGD